MIRSATALAALAIVTLPSGPASAGCPGAGETPCKTAEGEYHIMLPDTAYDSPVPAVVFLHGWRSRGHAVLDNEAMVRAILDRGYSVIAPNGSRGPDDRTGGSWIYREDHTAWRDDHAFLAEVADDAAARHGIDRERMVLAGFSTGGSMVTYVACETPQHFAAYAPVGGSFWRPHPDACTAPVRLFHIHGWSDGTVPLEGRFVADGTIAQGDVFRSMEILRAVNGCVQMRPDSYAREGDFLRRSWTDCAEGSGLEMVLFPGGHQIPPGWAEMMLDWFETLPESTGED